MGVGCVGGAGPAPGRITGRGGVRAGTFGMPSGGPLGWSGGVLAGALPRAARRSVSVVWAVSAPMIWFDTAGFVVFIAISRFRFSVISVGITGTTGLGGHFRQVRNGREAVRNDRRRDSLLFRNSR
ncbi:hypothetical protein GCM10025331_27140 [Actinoplanes utahensis]|nr:hypothetical protein Aut01nite_38920 [Actinoplanes utahensis]